MSKKHDHKAWRGTCSDGLAVFAGAGSLGPSGVTGRKLAVDTCRV